MRLVPDRAINSSSNADLRLRDPPVFFQNAGVHHDVEPRGSGLFRSRFMLDAFLHPNDFGANGDGGIDDRWNHLRTTEDVYDLYGLGYVFESAIGLLTQNLWMSGIYRDNPISLILHVFGHAVTRTHRIVGQTYNGDRLVLAEDITLIRHSEPHPSSEHGGISPPLCLSGISSRQALAP